MTLKKSVFITREGWLVRILYKVGNINKDTEKSQFVHYSKAIAVAHSIFCLIPYCFSSFLLNCLESFSPYKMID